MSSEVTRRTVLAVGAAVTLGGCSTYGEQKNDAPAAKGELAKVADIPVGGGKVFKDRNVVVTQPTQGTIKCFSAICTHQGCTVGDVSGGTINCPCHGSKFKVADGSVANGPATKPLEVVNVTVSGDTITL